LILFFGCRHINFPQRRKDAKDLLCAFAPLRAKLLSFVFFWFSFGGLVFGCRFLVAAFSLLRRRGLALLRGFRSLDFTRIVNQLDDRELGGVAVAMAQFQNARVTAWPILVTIAKLAKQTSQRCHAGCALGPQLTTLACDFLDGGVTRVKETRCLSSQVQRLQVRTVVRQAAR